MRWLLAVALLVPLKAEIVCALGAGAASYKPAADQRPSGDALQLAGRVNAALKTICGAQCPTMAVLRNATAPNAMLIADAGQQAKLVYAPQFFAAAYDSFGDSGIVAVIAHVVGHALDATMGAAWIRKSWTPELRADAWAGCILQGSIPASSQVSPPWRSIPRLLIRVGNCASRLSAPDTRNVAEPSQNSTHGSEGRSRGSGCEA